MHSYFVKLIRRKRPIKHSVVGESDEFTVAGLTKKNLSPYTFSEIERLRRILGMKLSALGGRPNEKKHIRRKKCGK